MLHFVDLNDAEQGLAVMSKGLREYEVVDDQRRTLAITLMRSHRAYMRALKGPMTPDEYDQNPGQHSIGTFEVEYAVMPHMGDWREAGVLTSSPHGGRSRVFPSQASSPSASRCLH
jgi:mannosylglycerate hydrolase